ncbi:MAG: TIGR04255 family protein [Ignavibacteriaceae bacterium]|nr:TIGR04255 family protein [Ignavibacteriaceae bacterium]
MESLPKKLSPNPLISAGVEIRFKDDILNKPESKIFLSDLELKENTKIKKEVLNEKTEEEISVFETEDYFLLIGKNIVSFEIKGEYKLWEDFFSFIKNNLSLLSFLFVEEPVIRVGVRFISVFKANEDFNRVANIDLSFVKPDTIIEETNIQTTLYRSESKLTMKLLFNNISRITVQGKVNEGEKVNFFDIDAYKNYSTNFDLEKVISDIDMLHIIQKKEFFNLIKPDYLKNLNPEY